MIVAAFSTQFAFAEKSTKREVAQSYLSIQVSGYYGSPKSEDSEISLKGQEGKNLKFYLEHDFSGKKKMGCSLECTSENECSIFIKR